MQMLHPLSGYIENDYLLIKADYGRLITESHLVIATVTNTFKILAAEVVL